MHHRIMRCRQRRSSIWRSISINLPPIYPGIHISIDRIVLPIVAVDVILREAQAVNIFSYRHFIANPLARFTYKEMGREKKDVCQ